MFTGLVREMGRIQRIANRRAITRLAIVAPVTAPALAVGDSLAVNGICLTVITTARNQVEVEATQETRRVTTLATWTVGDAVHLEPPLRAGDPIGGHFVLGHVDGVGRVVGLRRRGRAAVLRVALPAALASQLIPKGSIAVDGVSLTLDEGPFRDAFSITLVPHTIAVTRLGRLRSGDAVNVELDVLTKAARQIEQMEESRPPLTMASLLARGWQAAPRA